MAFPTGRSEPDVLSYGYDRGLDEVNPYPCDKPIMANLTATMSFLGEDAFCKNYIMAFRQGKFDQ